MDGRTAHVHGRPGDRSRGTGDRITVDGRSETGFLALDDGPMLVFARRRKEAQHPTVGETRTGSAIGGEACAIDGSELPLTASCAP